MIKSKRVVKNNHGTFRHKTIVAAVLMAISPVAVSMTSYSEKSEAHGSQKITPKAVTFSQNSLLKSQILSSQTNSSEPELQLVSAQNRIVFVDTSVPDYQRIVNAIEPGAELFFLNAESGGVQQIADVLKHRRNVQAVHVVAHGDEASIQLGSSSLSAENLSTYQAEMSVIRASLALEGDLLLYSCNTGRGERGQQFIENLAMVTGADVAASNDLTGSADLNGDWDLEVRSGEIESDQPWSKLALKDFNHVLVTETLSSYTDQGATLTSSGTLGSSNFVVSGSDDVSNFFGAPTGAFLDVGTQDTAGLWLRTDADGTNLQAFELTSLNLTEFEAADVFQNLTVTGYVSGGGTVTGNITTGTSGPDSYTANLTNFSGVSITGFQVGFDAIDNGGTSYTFDANLEITSFTWNPAVLNVTPILSISNTSLTYSENATATQIDSTGTLTDSDGDADWNGGTLEVQITANAEADDEISIPDNVVGTINTTGSSIRNGATTIGALSASEGTVTNGTKLTITFSSSATNALVQQVLQAISYRSTSDNPGTSNRTITFTATDKNAAAATDTRTVAVNAVNDIPTLTSFASTIVTTAEDTEVAITFSDLNTQGDEADVDGTIASYVVQAVSSGTLKIGASAGAAAAYAVSTNDTIDGSNNAYWTPAVNVSGNQNAFTVKVTDNLGALSSSSIQAQVAVTAVADTPSITGASTNEDIQSTTGLVISRNANDSTEVTHFKITGITGGTLYKNDGTTAIANNEFITFAEGSSGLKFTPSANSSTSGTFDVQAGTDGAGGGLSAGAVTATITVASVADTPSVTGAATNEDIQSTTGLVISRNANDSTEVTHFKITGISNGTLYKNDGTTAIANNEFITFAEGNAGLKFTPSDNSSTSGTFDIQAGTDGVGGGLSAVAATATITVTPVADTPNVTGTTTNEDTQSTTGLVISRNAVDGAEVTHYKITAIAEGTLYKNDGTTVIANNAFITVAEGGAGLKFTPTANSTTSGTFDIQAGTDGIGGGLSAGSVTATVSITPVNDAPTLTNLSGDSVNFTIGGNGVVLDADGNATLTDSDSTDFNGGNVTVSIAANAQSSEDVLQIGTVGAIAISGSDVTHTDGFIMGSFAGGATGASLVITLNVNATVARVRDLISALQYSNSNASTVNTLARTVRITVNDGDGGSATSANQDITVSLVRAPILDLDGDNSSGNTVGGYNGVFTEDGGAVAVADFDTTISDDGSTHTSLKATLTARPDGDGVESLSSTIINGATVGADTVAVASYNSGTGELIFTAAGGDADGFLDDTTMTALMSSVRYNNTSENPNTANRNIEFVAVDSSALTGAVSTSVMTVNRSNDSMAGTVAITGTPTEHLVLTADTSGLTDVDGLGTFSYQWKRSGSDIGSATSATYTLVRADVGETMTVVASQTDDGGTLETSTSAPTTAVAGDLDGDTIIDGIDTDSDGDGMSDDWETANGLDPFDASDAAGDIDGDGLTNLFEYDNGKDATVDDNPPTVTAPATVNINATGLFTPVSLGSASATDIKDGALIPTSDAKAYYQPGVHTVTWSATDAAGNTGTATQTVNVSPLVELSKNQVTAEGATATFNVILNGSAVTYPVTVPYTLSGTASTDGSDHDLVNGTATITSPNLSTTITANIVDDGAGEGVETVVVTLGTPTNAVVGPKSTHTMTIIEGNVAPDVRLSVDQGSGSTRLVQQAGSNVVVTALVTDPNSGDTFTYDWSETDNALTDLDANPATFTFDPTTEGSFILGVTVTDNGTGSLTGRDEMIVSVKATLPTLDASDTDGDAVDDITEGLGDSDKDGIPDYLDNANLPSNTLQEKLATSDEFVIETEPGLSLQLGQVAFRASGSKASVSDGDIASHANQGTGAQADEEYRFNGGVFDFSVKGLPVAGQSVEIVIPQLSAIPANAEYRKLQSGGWMTFTEDANNSLASATGVEGFCPPPGDVAYQAGLNEGHWCVQLTIEDGGPNDADGQVNSSVDDPGGVAVFITVPPTPTPVDIPVEVKVSSGGGSLNPLWISLLGLFAVPRLLATRKKGVKNETV